MIRSKTILRGMLILVILILGIAQAADIGGIISTTVRITDNSRLVDDVVCTMTDAPCIDFGAPNISLDLNGFTMTGQADPRTGCSGTATAGPEQGIRILQQSGFAVRGPGVVQRFRNHGINVNGSSDGQVTGVTASRNCSSGIFFANATGNLVEGNTSVANGNLGAPCGGI